MRGKLGKILYSTVPAEAAGVSSYYMDAVRAYPVLSREQEVAYGKAVQAGLKAERELSEMRESGRNEDPACVSELESEAQRGKAAQEAIVNANLRLVVCAALSYGTRFPDIMDAIQAGNMGLMTAAKRFDPDKGTRFRTYALWWIRQAIFRAEPEHIFSARIPVNMYEMWIKIKSLTQQTEGNCKALTDEEIAKRLGCTTATVKATRIACAPPVYLSQPTAPEKSGRKSTCTYGECLIASDSTELLPESQDEARRELKQIFDTDLTERERMVLRMRFGLDGNKSLTLGETGTKLGISGEWVRKTQEHAIEKLKNRCEEVGLSEI